MNIKITALYLNLQSGDRIRVAPGDPLWVNERQVTMEELPLLLAVPENILTIRTKAQEASSQEEYEAIMESDEAEPWAKAKLPPMMVAYDTIYARAVTSIISVTDEETTND